MLSESASERLVDTFLAGRPHRTRRAYAGDLEDFAQFRERPLPRAVAELLAGPEEARRMALDFSLHQRRRGRAQATVRRRLSTLGSLARSAMELGLLDWTLDLPTDEQIAEALHVGPGSSGDVPYFLPRHTLEIDRLDIQHYALRQVLGANHVAPVVRPARVLDVGSGTGQWAYELCTEFPDALVVGLDLQASKQPYPGGYRFVRANVLQGLPFASDCFDFVHQRLLLSAVPVRSWSSATAELVRVTRPNGWIELVEGAFEIGPAGPATRRLFEMTWRLGRDAGLDTDGVVYRGLGEEPARLGLVDASSRVVSVPFGEWGGSTGSLMATDCRALFVRLAPVFESRFGMSTHECRELLAEMSYEWEEHHTVCDFTIVVGRKPPARQR